MTLQEAQQQVDQWINRYGVRYFGELTNLALLMEETGELARIIARKYGEQSAKPADEEKDLADEMADVLFVLICLANQTGVDLQKALEANLAKKTARDNRRHLENCKLGTRDKGQGTRDKGRGTRDKGQVGSNEFSES
jgi:NTP pyrophosphatase (non-canonical NTP hydrolase)